MSISAERNHSSEPINNSQVAQAINELQNSNDIVSARNCVSGVIKTALVKKGALVEIGLRQADKDKIRSIIEDKIPDPNHRPLDLLNDKDVQAAQALNRYYDNIDIYAMSRDQFFVFSLQVANGVVKPLVSGKLGNHYMLIENQLQPDQQEEIFHAAIRTRYERVVGKNKAKNPSYSAIELTDSDTHHWQDSSFFTQAVISLSTMHTQKTAQVFSSLAQTMLDEEKFKKSAQDRDIEFCEFLIFQSMKENIEQHTYVNEKTSLVEEIADENVAQEYLSQLPMLRALSIKLQNKSWNDNGKRNITKPLNETIALLGLIDKHIKQSKADLN